LPPIDAGNGSEFGGTVPDPAPVAAPGGNWTELVEIRKDAANDQRNPQRRTPENVLDFIGSIGGIKDETGDLVAMDAHLFHQGKPFQRRIVDNENGLSLDEEQPMSDQSLLDQYRQLPPRQKIEMLRKLSRDPSAKPQTKAKLRRAASLSEKLLASRQSKAKK